MVEAGNIIEGKNGQKYYNFYEILGNKSILHITDNKAVDYNLIIDTEDIDRLRQNYWALTMVGKLGHRKPQVYTLIDKTHKLQLNKFILNYYGNQKIIFKDRNQLNFTKENLIITVPDSCESRSVNRYGIPGMNNIRKIYKNGALVYYQVLFRKNGKNTTKAFRIDKFNNADVALRMAIRFRDAHTA